MAMKILLVFPRQRRELADLIEEAILDAFEKVSENIQVDFAGDDEKARQYLSDAREKYDFAIIHIFLPKDRKSLLVEKEQRGLELLKWLVNGKSHTLGILFTDSEDMELFYEIQKWKPSRLVSHGTENWEEKILDILRQTPNREEKIGNVDITLYLKDRIWTYNLQSLCSPFCVTGRLKIEAQKLESLIRESRYVANLDPPLWKEKFFDIGGILKDQIFKKNPEFHKHFGELMKEVGSKENLRIRFVVAKEVHPIALEALLEEPNDKYWMLNAPIYRKLAGVVGQRYPLFHGSEIEGELMNCLIIQANMEVDEVVEDFQGENGGELILKPLENVPNEVEWLEDFLESNKNDFGIGTVKVLRPEPGEQRFSERVAEEMTKSSWHLVHYGGHSFYQEDMGEGFVFLPDKNVKPVSIEKFSLLLKNTRFIFLSSCHSSERGFVFELAENQVPAILGFRWEVENGLAFEYAQTFYKEAFAKRSLDKAFLKSGQDMKDKYGKEKIWASPILVMQV